MLNLNSRMRTKKEVKHILCDNLGIHNGAGWYILSLTMLDIK